MVGRATAARYQTGGAEMTVRHPPAPFTAPVSGSIEQRLAAVADAINSKASAAVAPAYHSLALISADGTTWAITVENVGGVGVLHIDMVPRT